MSEMESPLWGASASAVPMSQLEWEQLMQMPGAEGSSLRKRNRPISFDAISLQFQEGGSQSSWGEQFLNGGAIENQEGAQLFGGYGERVDSFLADSGDSSFHPERAQNPRTPESTSESSATLPDFELLGDAAAYGRQVSDPLPNPSMPAVSDRAPVSRQASDPLPAPSRPAFGQLAPTLSEKVVSKDMTTEEIYRAYAQSWGGALKAKPKGPESGGKTATAETMPEKLKRAPSKLVRTANAAKAQAASIIRDLFRRPGAKRQAVPLDGGQIGSLEKALGQLSAQAPARPPQGSGPIRTGSGSTSMENKATLSPAQSQSVSLPPLPTRKVQAPPKPGKRTPVAPADDLASLQKEAEALLASMGGSSRQEQTPPVVGQVTKPLTSAGRFGPSLQKQCAKEGEDCPLLQAVDRASCQVARVCLVNLDAGLLMYDPVAKAGGNAEQPSNAESGPLDRQVSFGALEMGDLAGLDWLLQSESATDGFFKQPASATSGFSSDPNLWGADFSDLLADAEGSVRLGQGMDLGAQTGGVTKGPQTASGIESSSVRNPMHRLWAQLEPSQIREQRFHQYRSAYKEELRRLRIWTATYVGEPLLPAVANLHFFSCNALPNLRDRQARMMMTKGMLWSAFVTHSLETASPADLYYARHDGQQAYKVANPLLLENMTVGMQYKCKNMCFLAEDLKDEATFGSEIYRTYGALHKSIGVSRPPPPFGQAYQQITFPELTDPKPSPVNEGPVEVIQFDKDTVVLKNKICAPGGPPLRWGSFWFNKQRLLSTGKGLREAGERARDFLQTLAEGVMDAHVDKFDVMATGASPTLERYLGYARCDLGVTMGLGLAFCAIGQELADAGRWDPTSDEVEQLFEETTRAKVLAGNVVRIMSDLRTYQADLVQLRLNAVAVRMREAHCSHKEALDFLIARASSDIESLAAEIKAHGAKDPFARMCWRLTFEVCRVSVALFTILGSESRVNDLFELK